MSFPVSAHAGCGTPEEMAAEIERLRARVAELEGALRDVLDSPRDGNHGKRVQGARSVLSGTPSERVAQRSEQAAHNGTVAGSTTAAFTTSDGWHDISTAPKDGTEILAWDGDYVIVKANPDGGWSDDFQQYLRLDKWMPLPPRPGDRTDSGEAQSISLNQTSIPEGYVLVPREPDADMAEVARDWAQRDWNAFGDPKGYLKFYQGIYRAMINAVPKPEGE